MFSIGPNELLFIFLSILLAIIYAIPWFRIFKRTGKPTWLALLMIIPIVNLVILYWFAYTEWEIKD